MSANNGAVREAVQMKYATALWDKKCIPFVPWKPPKSTIQSLLRTHERNINTSRRNWLSCPLTTSRVNAYGVTCGMVRAGPCHDKPAGLVPPLMTNLPFCLNGCTHFPLCSPSCRSRSAIKTRNGPRPSAD